MDIGILEGLCNLQVLRRSLLISDLWPHTAKDSDVTLQLLIHGRLLHMMMGCRATIHPAVQPYNGGKEATMHLQNNFDCFRRPSTSHGDFLAGPNGSPTGEPRHALNSTLLCKRS